MRSRSGGQEGDFGPAIIHKIKRKYFSTAQISEHRAGLGQDGGGSGGIPKLPVDGDCAMGDSGRDLYGLECRRAQDAPMLQRASADLP